MERTFILNPNACIGCRSCEIACKQKHGLNFSLRKVSRVLSVDNKNIQYISIGCNHCENPDCLNICDNNAFIQCKNGIILHDDSRCNGCNRCIEVCQFKGPRFNQDKGKVVKCDFCHDLLIKGKMPACVDSCPTQALSITEVYDDCIKNGAKNISDAISKPRYYIIPFKPGKQFLIKSK